MDVMSSMRLAITSALSGVSARPGAVAAISRASAAPARFRVVVVMIVLPRRFQSHSPQARPSVCSQFPWHSLARKSRS